MVCTNTLDDFFLNRCLREVPPGLFYMMGDVIQVWRRISQCLNAALQLFLLLAWAPNPVPLVSSRRDRRRIAQCSNAALQILLLLTWAPNPVPLVSSRRDRLHPQDVAL